MIAVDWLVFSRDRACQLDALLTSLERHGKAITRSVGVLYHATAPEYDAGYGIVRRRFPWAWLVPEVEFEEQVRTWLAQATDTVGFLVDDALLYRTVAGGELELPFSLRLGLNCAYQHPTGLEQAPPDASYPGDRADDVIAWKWRGAEGDFGYPFSLDGHVYERRHLAPLLESLSFFGPTMLEAGIASRADELPFEHLHAFALSHLVTVPANRVTEHASNPTMPGGPSVAELNFGYLRGRRIAPERMEYAGIAGAHWEVPYVYT